MMPAPENAAPALRAARRKSASRARRGEVVDTVVASLTRALVPEGAGEAARHHKFLLRGSLQR